MNGNVPTEALLVKVKNRADILSRGRCVGVWSVGPVWGGECLCASHSHEWILLIKMRMLLLYLKQFGRAHLRARGGGLAKGKL